MTDRTIWMDRIKAQLDIADAEIARSEAKAKAGGVEAKAAAQEYLDTLYKQRDEMSAKLKKIQDDTAEAGSALGQGFEAAWNQLTASFRSAQEKFTR